ncbi:MAG: CoA transferase [Rhodocyclaceae bacterium]|nr:CoA transferase [Rhodocyclaceae bacterium]MCA3074837.1 CoA transferase [Rhodocyclaceae bacterium]MCA3090836.1 CoA transferase [Rhodocyclaceae bacterium]MCA3095485.1 CoA transferase [Rhodocyclaceae bacterium]MCA3099674.1 CoA transferase [Rhodocyclaceae bacterium]
MNTSVQRRPLAGITVVSVEQAVAAPFAARQLGDLGARVIKVERPDGGDFARGYDKAVDGQSAYFVWLNRNKESLSLDLKQEAAREALHRLVERADVFIQNLAPGAVERLGFGAAALRAKHPRLITCDISGYGATGPYADKKAYDLLIQSESGVLSVTGTADTPCKVGVSIADIATGMHAYSAILAALYRRERDGCGAHIEVPMFDCLVEWNSHPVYYTHYSGNAPRRSGPDHATIVPYGKFDCADGRSVMLGLQNEREWAVFCDKVLDRPELARDDRYDSNTRRTERRTEMMAIFQSVFSQITAAELVARLDAAGIANGRLNTPADVWDHPQLTARERWREVEHPGGTMRAVLPPASFDDFEAAMAPVPTLAEHTDRILSELGYSAESIRSLHASCAA